MKQTEIIKNMTDKQIKNQLLLSQGLFFLLSIILSFVFFTHITDWLLYFNSDVKQILYYGMFAGIIVVIFEIILYYIIPETYFDDGGINEKVFKNQTIGNIFLIALVELFQRSFYLEG